MLDRNMDGAFAFFVLYLLIFRVVALQDELNRAGEPQCNSQFDFDLKVVENIHVASLKASEKELRHTVATLQETVDTLQETIRDKSNAVQLR